MEIDCLGLTLDFEFEFVWIFDIADLVFGIRFNCLDLIHLDLFRHHMVQFGMALKMVWLILCLGYSICFGISYLEFGFGI